MESKRLSRQQRHNPRRPARARRDVAFPSGPVRNAASRSHSFGWTAEEAVDRARQQVASVIGATPKEIIWTSGATESDNAAILGAARMYAEKGKHIITCKIEHKAVIDPCKFLENRKGFEVTWLDPDEFADASMPVAGGRRDPRTTRFSCRSCTRNNEIGTINPIGDIGAICKEKRRAFPHRRHAGVWQDGRSTWRRWGSTCLSLSGPQDLRPQGCRCGCTSAGRILASGCARSSTAAGHERGMRSGTLNVPGIVGLRRRPRTSRRGEDVVRCGDRIARRSSATGLWAGLERAAHRHHAERAPEARGLAQHAERELQVRRGREPDDGRGWHRRSAAAARATSASLEPSYVLKAMGLGDDLAHSSIRMSLGRFTTEEDIDYTIEAMTKSVTTFAR